MTEIRQPGPSLPGPLARPVAAPVAPAAPSVPAAAPGRPVPLAGDRPVVDAALTQLTAPPLGGIPALPPTHAEPGLVTLVRSPTGDFAVQASPGATPHQTARLAVTVNAGGTVVGYDAAAGQLSVDAAPTATPARGVTLAIAGGGGVTNWGRGYMSVDSAAGDSVSLFDQGHGTLDFCGRLAPGRPEPHSALFAPAETA